MLASLTTIGGLTILAVNLKEVCKAKAAGLRITLIIFNVVSTEQLYKVGSSIFIFGAFVFAIELQTPAHLKVFFFDTKNFNTKFYEK